MTMRDGLGKYCLIVRPDIKVSSVPFWVISLVAKITNNHELKIFIGLMEYFEEFSKYWDPTKSEKLFGKLAIYNFRVFGGVFWTMFKLSLNKIQNKSVRFRSNLNRKRAKIPSLRPSSFLPFCFSGFARFLLLKFIKFDIIILKAWYIIYILSNL